MIEITRKIEFDAGHRIPDHNSKCRNAHGHRYVLEATVRGPVIDRAGTSEHGMIKDFGDLKEIMMRAVGNAWDHSFLVYEMDNSMINALVCLGPMHQTVALDRVPTVENLVQIAAEKIHMLIASSRTTDMVLHHVRLYETPNCWADWYATGSN